MAELPCETGLPRSDTLSLTKTTRGGSSQVAVARYVWDIDEPHDRVGRVSFSERERFHCRLSLKEGPSIKWHLHKLGESMETLVDRDVTLRQALRDADEDSRRLIVSASLATIREFEHVDPGRVSELKAEAANVKSDFADYFPDETK
jgi:hypothetical protein